MIRAIVRSVNKGKDSMETLSVQITVYRNDTNIPQIIRLGPSQYFDLDPDEAPDVDSAPRYSNLEEYVDDADDITKLALILKNHANGRALHIEKVYQNQRKSTVTTRCEYQNESLIHQEVICESLLPHELIAQGRAYDLCRFVVNGDAAECVYHGIFYYDADGKETEYRIF